MVRSLYGFNSVGAAFQSHLADCMHHLGFFPCPVDIYLWMKPMVRLEDGFEYYACVLIYVDDVMVIHHDAESVIHIIDKYFRLNTSSIGDPSIYLVAKLKNMRLDNRVW